MAKSPFLETAEHWKLLSPSKPAAVPGNGKPVPGNGKAPGSDLEKAKPAPDWHAAGFCKALHEACHNSPVCRLQVPCAKTRVCIK